MVRPSLIEAGKHQDERGILSFFNDLSLTPVQRMYWIDQQRTDIIRAWQAHRIEQKWFIAAAGSFLVAVVQPDDWNRPSADLPVQTFVLEADKPAVLHIPGGYANGFRALKADSRLMVFSDASVEQSRADDFRFDKDLWFHWELGSSQG